MCFSKTTRGCPIVNEVCTFVNPLKCKTCMKFSDTALGSCISNKASTMIVAL